MIASCTACIVSSQAAVWALTSCWLKPMSEMQPLSSSVGPPNGLPALGSL